MKITPMVINTFAGWLAGGVAFNSMKTIVSDLDNTALSGSQKRDTAIAQFEKMGYSLAGFVVNLLVELAVSWIKTRVA